MTEIQVLLAFMRQSKRKSIKRSSLERWFEMNDYWIKERQLKLFQQLQRSKVLRIMENGEIIRVEAMKEYFMLFDYMQTQRKSLNLVWSFHTRSKRKGKMDGKRYRK